jgi:hypothetical protein
MPPPPMPQYDVPGLMRLEMHYLWREQHCMNVFYCKSNLNETSAALELELAGTFKNWWTAEIRPLISNTVQLYEIVVKEVRPDGIAVLYTDGLPVTGEKTEVCLPNNVSLAVHWGTGLLGRSRHGRTFHLGITQDFVSGNTVTNAADIQSAYDALRTTLDSIALNVEFSVVSYVAANAWRRDPLVTPISGVAVEPTIDSQRRRLPGRGQ